MAYEIRYGPKNDPRFRKRFGHHKCIVWIGVILLLIGFRFTALYDRMMHELIPGDASVSAAAWDEMNRKLEAGEGISDAFACFCQEILDNADLP